MYIMMDPSRVPFTFYINILNVKQIVLLLVHDVAAKSTQLYDLMVTKQNIINTKP